MPEKRMYIYLARNKQVYKLGRVTRNSNGLINGDYWKAWPTRISNIPEWSEIKDVHFTYPVENDYHITLVFKDGGRLNIYKDRVSGDKDKITTSRMLISVNQHMVQSYKPTLEEYKGHNNVAFPLISMDTSVITQFIGPEVNSPSVRDGDIWIKGSGNIVIRLLGKYADIMDEHFQDYKIDKSAVPYIFIGVTKQ